MSYAQPQPVSRYNEMLVLSVFVHCLILGGIMFIPTSNWKNKVVKPAVLQVKFIERPGVKPSRPVPPKPMETKVKPVIQKQPPPLAKKPVAKPIKKATAAKPAKKVAVKKPSKIKKPVPVKSQPAKPVGKPKKTPVRSVKKVPAKPAPAPKPVVVPPVTQSKDLFKELDQVASLPKKKAVPVKPKKTDSFLEEQVRELEALKASNIQPKVKRRTQLEMPTLEKFPNASASAAAEKHKKFQELLATEAKANPVVVPGTSKSRPKVMEDLESISQLRAERTVIPSPASIPKILPGNSGVAQTKEMESIRQELASLKQGDIKVDIKVGAPAKKDSSAPAFKSQTRGLSALDPTKNYVVATLPMKLSKPPAGGSKEADRLSEYVATIQEIVYSNWKSPVGAEHNQVRASFVVFPAGKIDRPSLVQSSGNEVLDNLALRAISASEPFPPFPKELKEPNLHIVVHFRYVYQE